MFGHNECSFAVVGFVTKSRSGGGGLRLIMFRAERSFHLDEQHEFRAEFSVVGQRLFHWRLVVQ